MQSAAENVYIHDAIYDYIVRLAQATRENEQIALGVSPRGTLALTAMAKAYALYEGRDYCIPSDIRSVFVDVVSHRLVLSPKARVNRISESEAAGEILNATAVPRLKKGKD